MTTSTTSRLLQHGFPDSGRLTQDDWANFRNWGPHPDADDVIADLETTGSLPPQRAGDGVCRCPCPALLWR